MVVQTGFLRTYGQLRFPEPHHKLRISHRPAYPPPPPPTHKPASGRRSRVALPVQGAAAEAAAAEHRRAALGRVSAAVTAAVVVLYRVWPAAFVARAAGPLIGFSILGVGVPHGALDHLVFYSVARRRAEVVGDDGVGVGAGGEVGRTADEAERARWRRLRAQTKVCFYASYTGTLLLQLLLWAVYPALAFWMFLVMSALHFGQDEMAYLQGLGAVRGDAVRVFLSRGAMLLGGVLTTDTAVTGPVVARLLRVDEARDGTLAFLGAGADPAGTLAVKAVMMAQHAVVLAMEMWMTRNDGEAVRRAWRGEAGKAALLAVLVGTVNPLIAFAVYFGWWHALGSVLTQLEFLKSGLARSEWSGYATRARGGERRLEPSSSGEPGWPRFILPDVKRFFVLALPFTSIALAFMAGFYIWTVPGAFSLSGSPSFDLDSTEIWTTFVICISSLTAPHLWVMMLMHESAGSQDSKTASLSKTGAAPLPPPSTIASLPVERPKSPVTEGQGYVRPPSLVRAWRGSLNARVLDMVDAVLP
ncbi:beta-carotene 15,15'-dioxygenase-domain-containing protein [Zopfochytrium polystomum]|nr:beta-carotene 15,15'-dioxygenase-domain-containing protein [Zopfochytrium polystomum]